MFDPFDLSLEVTPKATHEALKNKEFTKALVMSLKLNEPNLVTLVIERVPYSDSKCLQIVWEYCNVQKSSRCSSTLQLESVFTAFALIIDSHYVVVPCRVCLKIDGS